MMTAAQFFLCLLIIIILKESLASATSSPALEISPSPSPTSCVGGCDTELSQSGDFSSVNPAESMENAHGFQFHALPASVYVRRNLDCFARRDCITALRVGDHHVEHSIR